MKSTQKWCNQQLNALRAPSEFGKLLMNSKTHQDAQEILNQLGTGKNIETFSQEFLHRQFPKNDSKNLSTKKQSEPKNQKNQ